MTSTNRQFLLVGLSAIAARLLFFVYTGFTADDAFITFRYADNIAAGAGFVYNDGEKVLGTTTPLFTFVMAMLSLAKIPLIAGSLILSLACSAITAGILFRLAQFLRLGPVAYIAPLLYILWPRSLPADISGMETALFTMFVTAAIYFHNRRNLSNALAMATLATLTRPEGCWLLFLLAIDAARTNREAFPRLMAIPAVLILPWIGFAFFYFGSAIPNSIPAKLALYSRFGADTPLENLIFLMGFHRLVGWVLLLAATLGAIWLHRKQNYGSLAVIWIVGMLTFFAFSRTHLFFWYITPIYPIYLLLASASLVPLLEQVRSFGWPILPTKTLITLGITVVLTVGCVRQAKFYRSFQGVYEKVHKAIGLYLGREAGSDDLVAAEDIGYMGYYCGRKILDRDGLISPEAISYNRQGDYLGLVIDHRPDWVVAAVHSDWSKFVDEPEFREVYHFKQTFAEAGAEYRVYARSP